MNLKYLVAALAGGAITGGIALDVLGLPVAIATGAAAGVTAGITWYARTHWN